MKARIVLFNEIAVELSALRRKGGGYNIRGVYPKFLGRPHDPHLTFIAEARDGVFTPHFTAERDSAKPFRHYLPPIPAVSFTSEMTRFGEDAMQGFLHAVEPADLEALERAGWTVHWVNWRLMKRWLRPAARSGKFGEFRIDVATVVTFVRHVLRMGAPPSVLKNFPSHRPAHVVLLRFDEEGELHARGLFHFSEDCGSAKRGWNVHPCSVVDDAMVTRLVPPERLRQVRDEVLGCLARYPQSPQGGIPRTQATGSELPACVSWLCGFFATDLLHLALDERNESIALRRPPRGAPTSRHKASHASLPR